MKIFSFILILYVLTSCSILKKEQEIYYCDENNQQLLDSMQFIYALPDENYCPFGDSISERIINKGSSIVPCLIDQIANDTKTKARIADYYDYTVGDVAVFLLSNIYSFEKKPIPLRKMMISEFYNNEDDGNFFEAKYLITFTSNSEKVNHHNRVKYQKRIKKWYMNSSKYSVHDNLDYDEFSDGYETGGNSYLISDYYTPDSILVKEGWTDKNDYNLLTIRVRGFCKPSRPPLAGQVTMIESCLKNKEQNLSIKYTEDNYQTKMIFFDRSKIWFYKLNGIVAAFIPFFYCSDMDSEGIVSYMVLYNDKSFLYHFKFSCDNKSSYPNERRKCKLIESNLNQKLKDMPEVLRKELIKYLKSHYKMTNDLFPQIR